MPRIKTGQTVSTWPHGSPVQAFCRAKSVEEIDGGDFLVHGVWYFEDGSQSLSMGIYAAMCQRATKEEYEAAKGLCGNRIVRDEYS